MYAVTPIRRFFEATYILPYSLYKENRRTDTYVQYSGLLANIKNVKGGNLVKGEVISSGRPAFVFYGLLIFPIRFPAE